MNCFSTALVCLCRGAHALIFVSALMLPTALFAQGVTTGALTGVVTDAAQKPVAGATVLALHVPSGTTYEGVTRADGRYSIPGMRVGGPYSVTIAKGPTSTASFEPQTQDEVVINLGAATDLDFLVRSIAEEVTVTAQSDAIFSSERTGASTVLSREALATLPTISGRLNDMTRLTPQSGGTLSFAGQDSRLNNITVDGSYFNNSFGLRNSPGDTPVSRRSRSRPSNRCRSASRRSTCARATSSARRSIRSRAAAPINSEGPSTTSSATTAGSAPRPRRSTFNPGTFDFRNTGGWVGGPVIPNETFFFFNHENESFMQPGTTFRANTGGEAVGGSVTRVLESDLSRSATSSGRTSTTTPVRSRGTTTRRRRSVICSRSITTSTRATSSASRYNHLDSFTDILLSNSSSLGFGTRRTSDQRSEFPELQLSDSREHPLYRRRVELDPQRPHGQQPDRRLYVPG